MGKAYITLMCWVMPIPLSTGLRWRIVWLHHYRELSSKEIADLLYIHVTTVRRITNLFDAVGDVAPVSYKPGPNRLLSEPEEYSIIELLLANPGMFLDELQYELHQSTGTLASISTIFRIIRRLGFTRKRLRHIALQRSDAKRAEFIEEMSYIGANMIVWLDETGSDRRSARRRFGYHLRGMTPTDYRFTVHGKRLSSIGIMSVRGIEDVDTYEGSIDGDKFCDFVQRCLVPILQPFDGTKDRSVVVMDNASIHHVDRVVCGYYSTDRCYSTIPPTIQSGP